MKYLPFATTGAAFSFSHALAVQRGHDVNSKDVMFRVIPATETEDGVDAGAFLEVPDDQVDVLADSGLQSQLLDETVVEAGPTFPNETMKRKDGTAAVGSATPVAGPAAPSTEPSGETNGTEPAAETPPAEGHS